MNPWEMKIASFSFKGLPWIRGSKTKPGGPKSKTPSAGWASKASEGLRSVWWAFFVGEPLIQGIKGRTLYKLHAVPARIYSTCESYPQYLWVISSVLVSHILSTCESFSVPVRVSSTCEDMQYLWGEFLSFFIHMNLLTGTAHPHRYSGYDSRVLHILTGTAYTCCPKKVSHM